MTWRIFYRKTITSLSRSTSSRKL